VDEMLDDEIGDVGSYFDDIVSRVFEQISKSKWLFNTFVYSKLKKQRLQLVSKFIEIIKNKNNKNKKIFFKILFIPR
jgi:hypothetical protein